MDEKFYQAIHSNFDEKRPKRSISYNKVRSSNYASVNKTKLRGARSIPKVKRINVPLNKKFFNQIPSKKLGASTAENEISSSTKST